MFAKIKLYFMKRIIPILFFFFMLMETNAQNPFVGNYYGTLNGDNLSLNLESAGANRLKGKMKDSQQTYQVEAETSGKTLTGTAKENTFGITFQLKGDLVQNQLNMTMTISLLGQTETQNVVFTKQGTVQNNNPNSSNAIKIPTGASRDAALVGKWQQSESYSSGYGDNFFSGNSISNIIFLEDGSMADGGSQTTMSGSSYYGNSGMSAAKKIPNVAWYTQNQHIFIIAFENGQTQTVDVGKYYIENGKMLITATNGKKVLLTKQQN